MPAILVLEGDLSGDRLPEIATQIEAARSTREPLIVDLGGVRSAEALIAMDIVLFLRRRLRHGHAFAIVTPRVNGGWITGAASLEGAVFCEDRATAQRALSAT